MKIKAHPLLLHSQSPQRWDLLGTDRLILKEIGFCLSQNATIRDVAKEGVSPEVSAAK